MTLWRFILIIFNNEYHTLPNCWYKTRWNHSWNLQLSTNIISQKTIFYYSLKTILIFITTCFARYQWYLLAKMCMAKISHFCYYKLFSNRRWVLEKTPQHAMFCLATPCCSIWNGSKCTCGLFNKCLFILNRPRMILATRFD